MDLIEDLKWRDLVADCTDLAGLAERLKSGPITLYCGFDPTADSLHVGHPMGQLHLRESMGCELQIGGSDQWGNITAGTELIRRKIHATCFGLTFPLITKSDGTKFGKTEGGAVWLDPARTSPYRFYQFFVNTEDAMISPYLRKFTLLPRGEIEALEAAHATNPGARAAHKVLAREVTTLVHGASACEDAIRASEILFGGGLDGVSATVFEDVVGEVPTHELARDRLEGQGAALVDLLVHAGLSNSKGQARKDIEGGGIYLNNVRVADVACTVAAADIRFDQYMLLRKGK